MKILPEIIYGPILETEHGRADISAKSIYPLRQKLGTWLHALSVIQLKVHNVLLLEGATKPFNIPPSLAAHQNPQPPRTKPSTDLGFVSTSDSPY